MATDYSSLKPPDGGWGWFIVLATFITTAFGAGSFYAFGVLYVAFLDAFGESKAATSIIASVYGFCFVLMGPVGIGLSKRFGHRKITIIGGILASLGLLATSFTSTLQQVYFTYGMMTGGSLGMAVLPSMDMIGVYFKKRLSLAMGLAMAGTGGGQFLLSILSQMFVDMYGWRGTMLILSGIAAHVCVAGALMRPLTKRESPRRCRKMTVLKENGTAEKEEMRDFISNENNEYNNVDKDNSQDNENITEAEKEETRNGCCNRVTSFLGSMYDFTLFKEPVFYLLLVTSACQGIGHGLVTVYIAKRAIDFGISTSMSSLIPAAMGLSQLIGRPTFGALGNLQSIRTYTLYSLSMAICGVSTVISTYTRQFVAQVAYVILFGVGLGGYITLTPVVVADFMGVHRMGYGTSFAILVQGVFILCVTPLSGWMVDTSGVYDGVFLLAGVALLIGAMVTLFLPLLDNFMQRKYRKTTLYTEKKTDQKDEGKHQTS